MCERNKTQNINTKTQLPHKTATMIANKCVQ